MPSLLTEITELATGLGMLGYPSLDDALEARSVVLQNVSGEHWDRLLAARATADHDLAFDAAWENGRAFLEADDALRRRMPLIVEWKGPQHPPGYDFLPADLRVDHVFLISCKYLSKVLANVSPHHLFDRVLADRGTRSAVDWYLEVAPDAYEEFYDAVRVELRAVADLPAEVAALQSADRDLLKELCARTWPGELGHDYAKFSAAVSEASVARWNAAAPTLAHRELLLWRLLRFNSAPYFILGSTASANLRLRIATPWDWRQAFSLSSFEFWPDAAGQPSVRWAAQVVDHEADGLRPIEGHVEIRWSHGRFCGFPEAKVYLDTPHDDVPGYFHLV